MTREGFAGNARRLTWLLPVGVALLAFAFWQFASGRLVNSYYMSSPTEIAGEIGKWVTAGVLWLNVLVTLRGTLLAFCVAACLGIVTALLLCENRIIDDIFRPFVVAAFAVPFIALAPLLVAWLGVGFLPAATVACISSFFMIFFSAYSGIRETSPALLDISKLMGANAVQRALKIKLPAALPFVVEGLYTGLIYAFHGEVVGEMLASNSGLGYVIAYAASQMDAAGVIAGLVVLGTLAYGLILLLDYAYNRFLPFANAPRASAGLQ